MRSPHARGYVQSDASDESANAGQEEESEEEESEQEESEQEESEEEESEQDDEWNDNEMQDWEWFEGVLYFFAFNLNQSRSTALSSLYIGI